MPLTPPPDIAAAVPDPGASPVAAAPAADPATGAVPASFEDAVSELERIVEGMEDGQLSLEQSLAAYHRGTALARYCRATLADARQRVRVLEADLLVPLDDNGGNAG